MNTHYIVYAAIPIVSAMIGWLTNYIAVKMIFRPHRPITILGFRIQGLIPRRQTDLAHSLGETIERELISHKDIETVLQSDDINRAISEMIKRQVDTFMTTKLGANPVIAMFIQGDLGQQIKRMLVNQLSGFIPEFLDTCMRHVETKLDFKEIVKCKVENFDYVKLEQIVFRIAAKELQVIEILGGVLGFVVGIVQVGLLIAFQG